MLTHLAHAIIYVLDQERAVEFYTTKLGLEVRMDVTADGMRWVTLGSSQQPDLEVALMEPVAGPFQDDATVQQMRELISKGAIGAGVWGTRDCAKTHQEFLARGVEFLSAPTARPYGIEAVFKDDSGNWFSLVQPHA